MLKLPITPSFRLDGKRALVTPPRQLAPPVSPVAKLDAPKLEASKPTAPMKTASGRAFSALNQDNARVGFHTLWENASPTAGFLNVKPFDALNKPAWFSNLYAVTPTPFFFGCANCETPLPRLLALAQKYKVVATPTIVFMDGRVIPGALPKDRLEREIARADAAVASKVSKN